jgi:hypothetical protein
VPELDDEELEEGSLLARLDDEALDDNVPLVDGELEVALTVVPPLTAEPEDEPAVLLDPLNIVPELTPLDHALVGHVVVV